jgi:hypothetical protein
LAIIATCVTISTTYANLPKYGKWCGNLDNKLKAKAIDKIDKSCKRNFKCRLKSKTGFDKLNCDIDLIKYLNGRGKKYAKTSESRKIRENIISYFEKKAQNWN